MTIYLVVNVRVKKKLKARKMLENAEDSPESSARFVGWRFWVEAHTPKKIFLSFNLDFIT
jgi:hypothetical protein